MFWGYKNGRVKVCVYSKYLIEISSKMCGFIGRIIIAYRFIIFSDKYEDL